MKLYPWVGPPAAQDSGQLGPKELFIQTIFPQRATAMEAYTVSYLILPGAMSLPATSLADGTANAS